MRFALLQFLHSGAPLGFAHSPCMAACVASTEFMISFALATYALSNSKLRANRTYGRRLSKNASRRAPRFKSTNPIEIDHEQGRDARRFSIGSNRRRCVALRGQRGRRSKMIVREESKPGTCIPGLLRAGSWKIGDPRTAVHAPSRDRFGSPLHRHGERPSPPSCTDASCRRSRSGSPHRPGRSHLSSSRPGRYPSRADL